MVNTRHRGGVNDDSGEDFESLRPQRRRAAARQDVQVNGYESDDSDESPRRRRGSVKRKRNEDISPSPTRQMPPRRTTRHTETRRRSIYDRSPQRSSPEKSSRRRRVARRIEDDDDDDNDDDSDDEQPVVRRAPRRSASPSVRRSTRSRRSRYNNFDESLIEKHMALLTTGPLEPECDEDRPTKRRRSARHEVQPVEDEEETMDMYSRVKRVRKQVKRDMYGIPMTEGEDTNDESNEDEESNGEESNDEEQSETDEEPPQRKTYGLREHKPRTNFYEVPVEPHRPRNRNMDLFRDTTPPTTRGGRTRRNLDYHQSPARKRTNVPRSFSGSPASDSGAGSGGSPAGRRRRTGGRRKNKKFSHRKQSTLTKRIEIRKPKIPPSLLGRKAAFHGNSSTSSSSSESGDERRFEKRKNKSMAKSRNRCLPMNLNPEDVAAGTIRDRAKIGASMADVDPMNIDRSISFEHVGGLGKHVRSLKEMVVFPLLYPEVFERFKIQPPRGCLFYGPPGTGKTLVARALANECSTGDKKVSFFMRKGADCLSKWVGESERQLRLLFDQAYQMRPSIIFFDEIDGLAPVRSSRQDQIHSSIVSTLLALMDGLDNRGEIVIIGATNRIDSIDPALRRPGRFDREFLFPLPNVEARKQIVAIHTREWNPKLSSGFLEELAEKTVGYCGADLKALCTEAALHALRRRFPQIYTTQDKLQLDVSKIVVGAIDFHKGIQNIVPAAQRAVSSPARSLIPSIKPLLKVQLNRVLNVLCKVFPAAVVALGNLDTHGLADDLTESESDDDSVSIYEKNGRQKSQGQEKTRFLDFSSRAHLCPSTHRPRMLLAGEGGQGQTTHLAPAVLHYFERLPVHTLDLPTLYACSAKTPEESCAQVFHEAQRTSPSIIYMPHVVQWWDAISETCRATFLTLLQDQVPSTPLLLLATCESSHRDLPDEIRAMFAITADEIYVMQHPTESERMEFFSDLLLSQATKPPPSKKKTATRLLEELPKAPAPEPRKLTDSELKRLQKQEEATLRELRLFLRDVLNKLGRDRKFNIFAKPVDEEDVPDYYSIIQTPMDFTTMMSKIDMHSYRTVQEFLDDINLICSNCLEYNPDSHPQDRALRHRACAMRDTAYSIITTELDEEFEKLCQEIKEARSRRGDETKRDIPSYYYTKPLKVNTQQQQPTAGTSADSVQQRPPQLQNPDTADDQKDFVKVNGKFYFKYYKKISIKKKPSSTSLTRSKSPWCKPSRRKFKRVLMYVGEDGIEYPASEVEAEAKGSAVSDNSDSDDDNNGDNVVEVNGKKYRTVMKKVALKRKSSGSKISPWCKPSRRVFRNILYYIDEDGNEFPADEINKDTKSGSGKESDRERSPSARRRSGSRQSSEAEDADMEKENLPDSGRRSRQNSPRTRPGSSPAASRSRSPRGAGHSPRGAGHSPRVPSKSPAGSPRGRSSRPNSPAAAPLSPSAAHRSPSAAHRSPITKSPRSPRSQETFKDQSPRHRRSRGGASDVEAMDVDAIKAAIENTKTLIDDRSRDTPLNPVQDNCKSADEGEKEIRLLRTRSQTNPTQAQKALQILHEKKQKMVVDTDRLNHLLDKTVSATRGHNVEKLERLYSVYSQWIYQHRLEYNKTQLIVDLEAALEKYKRY